LASLEEELKVAKQEYNKAVDESKGAWDEFKNNRGDNDLKQAHALALEREKRAWTMVEYAQDALKEFKNSSTSSVRDDAVMSELAEIRKEVKTSAAELRKGNLCFFHLLSCVCILRAWDR